MRRFLAGFSLVALATQDGCGDSTPASHGGAAADPSAPSGQISPSADLPTPASCDDSDNAIDRAVCPRMHDSGCASAAIAPTFELCRRMFTDLTGAAPSPSEIATTCDGKTPREIAAALMATPEFVRHQQELWGEAIGYEPAQIDGKWLVDADAKVADLVNGKIGYDTFAKKLLAGPLFGVGARLPRSDVVEDDDGFFPQSARRALKVFLGRDAIAGEDVALAKLFRFWKKYIWVMNGDYGRAEPFIDPDACPCGTSVWGVSTEIVIPLGLHARWDDIAVNTSPALQAELEKVGALFVAQDPFWAQGADLALSMTLGWWKTTTALDQSLLPEVQLALENQLRAGSHSWRDMIMTIVTSSLYTRSNHLDPSAPDGAPVWCSGPLRVQRPEAYLASLGKLLDLQVGRCDHRTYERQGGYYPNGTEGAFFPYAYRDDEPSDANVFGVTDWAWVAANAMGGCTGGVARSEDPTLPYVFGAAPAAATLCNGSPIVMPYGADRFDKSDVAIAAIADHLSMLLRGRVPTPAERAAIAQDAAACVKSSTCDAHEIAVNTCQALARSTDVVTY